MNQVGMIENGTEEKHFRGNNSHTNSAVGKKSVLKILRHTGWRKDEKQ